MLKICVGTHPCVSFPRVDFRVGPRNDFYWLRPGPVRDFGTERALAEPLGPNTGNFPSSCPRFTLLTGLNLSLKARPEAHTFDLIELEIAVCVFIGSGPEPVRDFGTERALVEPLGPNTGNFPS